MAIRGLTREEMLTYSGACVAATGMVPAFRDGIAVLKPYFDSTAETAYTDEYARVGLSRWFFEDIDTRQRASVILHECMHVLNSHIPRGRRISSNDANVDHLLFNLAGDFEINCSLELVPKVDLSVGVFPNRGEFDFPPHLSMEKYVSLLVDAGYASSNQQQAENTGGKGESSEESSGYPSNDSDDSKSNEGSESNSDSSDKNGNSNSSDQNSQKNSDNSSESEGSSESNSQSDSEGGSGDNSDNTSKNGSENSQKSDGSENSDGNGGKDGDQNSSYGNSEKQNNQSAAREQDGSESFSKSGKSSNNEGSEYAGRGAGGTESHSNGRTEDSGTDEPHGCDSPTEERSRLADDAGITQASESEQRVAKANTEVRMKDELNKSLARGEGSMNNFFSVALEQMNPPKVAWRSIFRKVLAKASENVIRGRTNYTYRRVNRRLSQGEFIFPGTVGYHPAIMLAIDTSGSMGAGDYLALLSEVEGITKAVIKSRKGFSAFSVDTSIKKVDPVKSVADINLEGGGGTNMSIGLKYVNQLPKRDRPDVFILATDGGTDWKSYLTELQKLHAEKIPHILLITSAQGYKGVPDSIKQLAEVVDVSTDSKSW